jgi:hypothetical protein
MVLNFRQLTTRAAMMICACGAYSALAADWIGNPTPSDYFRQNLGNALVAGAQLHATMKQLTADIEEARRQYFSSKTSPAERPKAGDKFAKLLNDKDLIYAYTPLTHGLTPAMQGELELPFIDNGIPEENRNAYIYWLRAVRTTLGAKNDNAPLILIDADAYKRALSANEELYVTYQRIRDRTERWRWNERIGEPEKNTDEKHHDFPRTNVRLVPASLKVRLSANRQFSGWENAKFYADEKGTRYLVDFGRSGSSEREFLFDAAGETARFDTPASEQAAASRYGTCQTKAREANLTAPYFTWYADRCQFGNSPATNEEVKKWQQDGPELERLRAKHIPPRDNPLLQAEFSLKNYKCEMSIVPRAEAQKDPLLVPQCVDTYQLTDADQKQLEIMVKRLSR